MIFNKILLELKRIMDDWGLGQDDWALFLHYADILQGYDIKYDRDSHLHVMIPINRIPWLVSVKKINEETTVPIDSRYGKDFQNFMKKTGWDFHILVSDNDYFKKFIRNDATFLKIYNQKIRIATVVGNLKWYYVYLNQYAKKISPEVMARRMVWQIFIYKEALRRNDQPVIKEAKKLLNQFNSKQKIATKNKKVASHDFISQGIIKGQPAFSGKIKGKVLLIKNPDQVIKKIKSNLVLISKLTSPKLINQLRVSKAVITDEGGQLSHAAILCRELKIPCIVGTLIATQVLKDGDLVEVDANKGIVRKI
ncbi:MAG: PEP-utilizing enzyme [Candidatus Buchananbacteria bacterium]